MSVARFCIDATGMADDAARLTKLVIELLDVVVELADGSVDLFALAPKGAACFDLDIASASGAAKLRIGLKPSEGLLEFAAAAGARDRQALGIEKALRHFQGSIVGGHGPTIARVGEGG